MLRNDSNNNNKNNKKKKKKNKKHKNATKKMCYKLRYEKHITLCSAPARTRRAHETTPMLTHTSIHNPYGIADVRSSTLQ